MACSGAFHFAHAHLRPPEDGRIDFRRQRPALGSCRVAACRPGAARRCLAACQAAPASAHRIPPDRGRRRGHRLRWPRPPGASFRSFPPPPRSSSPSAPGRRGRPHHLVRLSRPRAARSQPRRRNQPESRGASRPGTRPRGPLPLRRRTPQAAARLARSPASRRPAEHRPPGGCTADRAPPGPAHRPRAGRRFGGPRVRTPPRRGDACRRPRTAQGCSCSPGTSRRSPSAAGVFSASWSPGPAAVNIFADLTAPSGAGQPRGDRRPRSRPDPQRRAARRPPIAPRPEWQAVRAVREHDFVTVERLRIQPAEPAGPRSDPGAGGANCGRWRR